MGSPLNHKIKPQSIHCKFPHMIQNTLQVLYCLIKKHLSNGYVLLRKVKDARNLELNVNQSVPEAVPLVEPTPSVC